jgi:ElaB/YqjD/DUF883 family membrane-anchored ribosome-binding protein
MSTAEIAREKVLANLHALVEDVEELVRSTTEQTDDRISSLRQRISHTLESVKGTLSNGGKELSNSSKQGARAVISYAEENPWTTATAGIATGAAMALVFFLWSRCTR